MNELGSISSSAIELAPGVSIRPDELRYHFARSGGPGGQNVNKVNSKAELRVLPEAILGMTGKAVFRLKTLNAKRMTTDGDLMIVSDADRSQMVNKLACLERLREFVKAALVEPKVRRKSRPTAGSRERRLESKKAHSKIKSQRRGGFE